MSDDNDIPYTRHERLAREFDALVLANKLRPECAKDLVDLFGPRCIVEDDRVTLDGKPLAQAAKDIVAARPYAQVTGALPEVKAREEIAEKALGGNVSAHGKLFEELGRERDDQWCRENGAKPGKPAVKPESGMSAEERRKAAADNPWMLENTAEANKLRGEYIKKNGPKAGEMRAREAGKTLGGKPLPGYLAA